MRLARKFCTAGTWELLAIYKNYIMEKEFYETAVSVTVPSPFFRTLSCSWLILFRTRPKSNRVRKNGAEKILSPLYSFVLLMYTNLR